MNYPVGSLWHKWDLHVHTPYSIVNNYKGDDDEAWENFIKDLESLPNEFKVIGINDYIFLDGYKRVLEYKKNNRLTNLDLILPVIELRLDKFVGTDEHWKRINFHIIFSNEVKPHIIEAQFLNSLSSFYSLTPEYRSKVTWSAAPTKDSLTELGELIKKTVPQNELSRFGKDIIEGFNALNFNYTDIVNRLKERHNFKGKFFTAIGKTEWDQLKWSDNTIAEKKTIINEVDFVFTASESIINYHKAKTSLTNAEVNDRLLDCSDAHDYSWSKDKDRIGNCSTWIKADTTFEGLRQTLFESDRVFIGETPRKHSQVSLFPTNYIKKIEIKKTENSTLNENWFNASIDLNSNMVAIIGKKGAGKSALIDILGLLGNSHIDKVHRPFLSEKKFGDKNKWANFEGCLTWTSNQVVKKLLDEDIDLNENQKVRFIPQNYFEEICNELQDSTESSLFYKEINNVIFSHVPNEDRLGTTNLQELISKKTRGLSDSIDSSLTALQKKNREIIDIEEKIKVDYKLSLQKQLYEKKEILTIHEKNKPIEVQKPEKKNNEAIKIIEQNQKELSTKTEELAKENKKLLELKTLLSNVKNFSEKLVTFKKEHERLLIELKQNYSDVIDYLNVEIEDFVKLDYDQKLICLVEDAIQKEIEGSQNECEKITKHIYEINVVILSYKENLDEEERIFRKYEEDLEHWNNRKNEITGNEKIPDTIKYFENEIFKANEVYPSMLDKLINDRREIVLEIYLKKSSLVEEYKNLYKPVHDFINNQNLSEDLGLRFSVSIVIENFKDSFFTHIHHGQNGTYCGKEPANEEIQKILKNYDFNSIDETLAFLDKIIESLEKDLRAGQNKEHRDKTKQVKQTSSILELYNFLFGLDYLQPKYVLKLGDKELYKLSPGEKGTLLLVFYLLVDKERIPLLIDQPEHNLDNETIYKLLVESVRIAKDNRQLIIVTHNPNLAVVCDAEQIIYASMDGENGNKVDYVSGSIENPKINEKIIDVLEGTKPAFNKRKLKYFLGY